MLFITHAWRTPRLGIWTLRVQGMSHWLDTRSLGEQAVPASKTDGPNITWCSRPTPGFLNWIACVPLRRLRPSARCGRHRAESGCTRRPLRRASVRQPTAVLLPSSSLVTTNKRNQATPLVPTPTKKIIPGHYFTS